MGSSRFRVALVAIVIACFLTLHHLISHNGYISVERIQKFFTLVPWKARLSADDEFLLGVGKADITG